MECVAAQVEVGGHLPGRVQEEAVEAVLLAPHQSRPIGGVGSEVAPLHGQPPEPGAGDPAEVARTGEDWLRAELLGDGLRVLLLHEHILEDGGGPVVRQFLEDRLHEVGGRHEELSSRSVVALARSNRRESPGQSPRPQRSAVARNVVPGDRGLPLYRRRR